MKKILFIHGYGKLAGTSGEGQRFRQVFGQEYEVRGVDYSQEEPAKGVATLKEAIEEWQPDAIVGCSLGGFFAMLVGEGTKTVVVNPCLLPSVELPKLPNMAQKNFDAYKPLEVNFAADSDNHRFAAQANHTIGFFGDHDEFFSYKSLLTSLLDSEEVAKDFDSGHHIKLEAWQALKPAIDNFVNR